MQVDTSSVNLSVTSTNLNTNVKDTSKFDSGTDKKTDSKDKFGQVLQKERKTLSIKENKTDNKTVSKVEAKSDNDKKEIQPLDDNKENVKLDKVLNSKEDNILDKNDKELSDEDIKDLSKDDILSYLAQIVELLKKLAPSNEANGDVSKEGSSDVIAEIPTEITSENNNNINNQTAVNADNSNNDNSMNFLESLVSVTGNSNLSTETLESLSKLEGVSSEEAVKILNNLTTMLKSEGTVELLNQKGLNKVQDLLKELGVKLEGKVGNDNTQLVALLKDSVKEANNQVVNLIASKSSEDSTIENKVVSETILKKEQDPKNTSLDTKTNVVVNEQDNGKNVVLDENFSGDNSGLKENSNKEEVSKEEKVLNSILDDDDKKVNDKFSLALNRLGVQKTDQVVGKPEIVNKNSIVIDVVKNVKFMVTNNIKEMTVKVNPEQLGELTIKVVQEDGVMKAHIKASSKETYTLLSQQVSDIKKHLGEQNIKIQEVNVSIYDEDTTFYKDGQFSNNSFNQGSNQNNKTTFNESYVEDEVLEEDESIDLSNINMLA